VRAPTQLNETPLCYSEFPTPILVAYFCFKLGLFCRGKDFGTGYMLHKAVFEGNLPLVSRLLNCQSDKFLYSERNQLDESGNTPLMLAVKLQNLDAVKVLTDSFASAKLNATP
jgi:hypothetical protein